MKNKLWKTGVVFTPFMLLFVFCLMAFPIQVQAATDTLNRYQNYKIYSVTQYGAINNGSGYSDTAFYQALKTALRDRENGLLDGKADVAIYVPSGSYRLKSTVRIKEKITLIAESDTYVLGEAYTTLQIEGNDSIMDGGNWDNTNNTSTVLYVNHAQNALVNNVTISSGEYGIKFRLATATGNDLKVWNTYKTGISLTGKSTVVLNRINVQNNGSGFRKGVFGHGIGVWDNSILTVNDSVINKNYQCGISLNPGQVTVNNTKIQYNKRHGIGTRSVCRVIVDQCDIYKNGLVDKMNGIMIVGGSYAKITNTNFRNNAVTGLLATDSKTSIEVKNCTFKNNGYNNIYLDNNGRGKIKAKLDSNTYYKCKKSESVKIHARSKSNYSLKVTGKNKYVKLKYKYTYWIGNKVTHSTKSL